MLIISVLKSGLPLFFRNTENQHFMLVFDLLCVVLAKFGYYTVNQYITSRLVPKSAFLHPQRPIP